MLFFFIHFLLICMIKCISKVEFLWNKHHLAWYNTKELLSMLYLASVRTQKSLYDQECFSTLTFGHWCHFSCHLHEWVPASVKYLFHSETSAPHIPKAKNHCPTNQQQPNTKPVRIHQSSADRKYNTPPNGEVETLPKHHTQRQALFLMINTPHVPCFVMFGFSVWFMAR